MQRFFVVLVLPLLMAACSSDGGDDQMAARQTATATAAVSATPTQRPSSAPSSTSAGTPAGQAMRVDLAKALLTSSDVPQDWRRVSLDVQLSEAQPCGQRLPLLEAAHGREQVRFAGGETGPFLTHLVVAYPPETAGTALPATRELLGSCRKWTQTYEGRELTFSVADLSLTPIGEEMVAVRLTIEGIAGGDGIVGGLFGDLITARSQVIVARRGDAVFLLAHTDAGLGSPDVDTERTERLARRADERLQAATRP